MQEEATAKPVRSSLLCGDACARSFVPSFDRSFGRSVVRSFVRRAGASRRVLGRALALRSNNNRPLVGWVVCLFVCFLACRDERVVALVGSWSFCGDQRNQFRALAHSPPESRVRAFVCSFVAWGRLKARTARAERGPSTWPPVLRKSGIEKNARQPKTPTNKRANCTPANQPTTHAGIQFISFLRHQPTNHVARRSCCQCPGRCQRTEHAPSSGGLLAIRPTGVPVEPLRTGH